MKRIATYRDFVGELTVTYRRTQRITQRITTATDAITFIRPHFDLCMDDHEEFKIIHLNCANAVVNVHELSTGSTIGTVVDVKLAVRQALHIAVQAVILVHNHPSGNLKFSKADKDISNKLKTAFAYFDIKVLDSLVITRESYISMADEGLL